MMDLLFGGGGDDMEVAPSGRGGGAEAPDAGYNTPNHSFWGVQGLGRYGVGNYVQG